MKKILLVATLLLSLLVIGCTKDDNKEETKQQPTTVKVGEEETEVETFTPVEELKAKENVKITFKNVTVHDPSVEKVGDEYYIFGSHGAAAKSSDLMNWTLVADGTNSNNKLFKNPDKEKTLLTELAAAFEHTGKHSYWAPDVIQLPNGKYYMYYCSCEGSMALSATGIAVADNIEGPYEDQGLILTSVPAGSDVNPNAVDPCIFFDKEGRLWMVYGSYSGGIFILELSTEDGKPLPDQGHGTKLSGGNHVQIEGAYIMYSPESDYYYYFVSYGGLESEDGYNMRMARSKNPQGPYEDYKGDDIILARGSLATASKYGVKIMGNYRFETRVGEAGGSKGYMSAGHNSAIYDEETGRYFLIFHTRFSYGNEGHQVRVHQMFLNEDGWFVVAPHRYAGETIEKYTKEDVVGEYKYINNQLITPTRAYLKTVPFVESVNIMLKEDGTIIGSKTGTWSLDENGKFITINIDNDEYKGVVLRQYNENNMKYVMAFTATSKAGISIYGSGYKAID